MDLQKNSFVKPAKSCPNWLKIILSKELDRLVQKYRIAIEKNISPLMCHTLLMIYIMIDNGQNKIENLWIQECSLKNSSFWKLAFSLKTDR